MPPPEGMSADRLAAFVAWLRTEIRLAGVRVEPAREDDLRDVLHALEYLRQQDRA